MPKRALVLPAILAGLLAPVAAASPAVAADGDCSVAVAQASTVSITSYSMHVPVVLKDSPAGCADYASFDVVRGDDADTSIVIFDSGARTDSWILGTSDGPGRYRLEYRHGYDQASDDLAIPAAGNEVVAKFSSKLTRVRVERLKRTAHLEVVASQYAYADDDYRGAKGRRVAFEQRTTKGWKAVETVTTSRKGVASAVVPSTSSTRWRARLLESATAWGAMSGRKSPKGAGPAL